MHGESDVRIAHVDTGFVESRRKMDAKWFGEGLVKRGGRLYQIAWQVPDGFIYDVRDLSLVGRFKTPLRDGWGVAGDGRLFVISDGSSRLTWVDPDDEFSKVKVVEVTSGGRPVRYLNEVRGRMGGG
jgi:glutamine cyclotransferase